MDETSVAIERLSLFMFRLTQHTQNLRALPIFTSCNLRLRSYHRTFIYRRNDNKDHHKRLTKGFER